jgi:recombination protein RecA
MVMPSLLFKGFAMTDKDRKIRVERLKKICASIDKSEEAEGVIRHLGSSDSLKIEKFSSGCLDFDVALGGGWPRGRFVELFGAESSGKTTACLHAIAEFQKAYPSEDVALIDTEFSFDEEYAKNLKVDTDLMLVHQPDNGEQAMRVLRQLIQHGVGLIIVDSVAALTPEAELAGDIGDQHVGQQARLMSQTMRILCGEAGRNGTTVFWTNQIREKIAISYGDKTTTPGGRALRHYSSIRVGFAAIGKVKDGENIVGSQVKIDVKKNKVAAPFKRATFYLSFGTGIDKFAAVCDAAITSGAVKKKGSQILLPSTGEILGRGRMDFINAVKNSPELCKKLEDMVKAIGVDPIVTEDEEGDSAPATKPAKKGKVISPASISRVPVTEESAALPEEAEGVEEVDA